MWIPRLKGLTTTRRDDTTMPRANGTSEGSPFLAARREFTNAFGDLARGKRNWQIAAFALLALLGLVIVAYVRLASGARVVPYLVEVDHLGQVAAVAPVAAMQTPAPRLIASQLAEFIRNVRTVLPSAAAVAESDMLTRAYAFTTPEAASYLNSYFSDPAHDPRTLGASVSRQVRVTSVLQVPKSPAWTVRWTETDVPVHAGGIAHIAEWEGYLMVRLIPPTTEQIVRVNPLGIYITAINWTELADTTGGTP